MSTGSAVFQRIEEFFQSINPDLVDGGEQHAELAFRPALAVEPFEVGYGEVAEEGVLVFAEGHFHGHEGREQFGVGSGYLLLHALLFG